MLLNQSGKMIKMVTAQKLLLPGIHTEQIAINKYANGIYYLKVIWETKHK